MRVQTARKFLSFLRRQESFHPQHLFIGLFLLLTITSSLVQTQRVLIIGDSWAQLQIDNTTHNQVFSNNGFGNFIIDPASDTVSDNGKTAADWAVPSQLTIIGDVIAANPAIDTVQLTIAKGGDV